MVRENAEKKVGKQGLLESPYNGAKKQEMYKQLMQIFIVLLGLVVPLELQSTMAFAYRFENNSTSCLIPDGIEKISHMETRYNSTLEKEVIASWKVEGKDESYPIPGEAFSVVRCLPNGKLLTVGTGIATTTVGSYFEGKVEAADDNIYSMGKTNFELVQSGNLYWRPMVGDLIWRIENNVSQKTQVTPIVKFSFEELFVQKSNGEYLFDLSSDGKEKLLDKFNKFVKVSGKIIIECFIDKAGNRDIIRQETQARADLINSFLVLKNNIKQGSTASIGLGNDNWLSGMRPISSGPKKDITAGVVIRVINY